MKYEMLAILPPDIMCDFFFWHQHITSTGLDLTYLSKYFCFGA